MKSELVWLILSVIIIIVDLFVIQKDLDDYIETKDKWYIKSLKEIVLSIILASFALGYNLAVLLIK